MIIFVCDNFWYIESLYMISHRILMEKQKWRQVIIDDNAMSVRTVYNISLLIILIRCIIRRLWTMNNDVDLEIATSRQADDRLSQTVWVFWANICGLRIVYKCS